MSRRCSHTMDGCSGENLLDLAIFALVAAVGLAVARDRAAAKLDCPSVPCEPRNWRYKAEGKHNVVMTYCGDEAEWDGIAIRLRKLHKGDSTETVTENHGLFPSRMDDFSRRVMRPLVGSEYVDLCQLVHLPVWAMRVFESVLQRDDYLRPITRRHTTIDTTAGFAVLLTDSTSVHAPASQVRRALGGTKERFVRLGAPVAVEIKPKAGLVVAATDAACPHEGAIAVHGDQRHEVASEALAGLASSGGLPMPAGTAHGVSKFRMQQIWKVTKGKALRASAYSPLQLFGSLEACRRSLVALAHTPHNNFRVFARGAVPFPPNSAVDRIGKAQRDAMARGHDRPTTRALTPHEYAASLAETLDATFVKALVRDQVVEAAGAADDDAASWHGLEAAEAAADAGFPVGSASNLLIAILAHILQREPLLQQLQRTQMLGQATTSRRLWQAYRPHLERAAGRRFDDASVAYKWARSEGTEGQQAVAVAALAGAEGVGAERARAEVQRFLIAQAACDCSLLVSMQLVSCADDAAVGQTQGAETVAASPEAVLRAARAAVPEHAHGREGGRQPAAAGAVAVRAIGAVRLQECCPECAAAAPSKKGLAHLTRTTSRVADKLLESDSAGAAVKDLWVVYRLSLVDLEPKLVARLPKYAAKDDDITAAFALFRASPSGSKMPAATKKV